MPIPEMVNTIAKAVAHLAATKEILLGVLAAAVVTKDILANRSGSGRFLSKLPRTPGPRYESHSGEVLLTPLTTGDVPLPTTEPQDVESEEE
ncbi:hypothetical protein N7465_005352 [Penicillium sp. CMV-2018d]|nr:hypothetical protein N7465_005352 [Penicillium sp. CMV-2018d]